MSWISRLRDLSPSTRLLAVALQQQEIIRQLQAANIEGVRQLRDLAIGWRVSIERPEIDVRDDLDAMIRDVSDKVAVMEEHHAPS